MNTYSNSLLSPQSAAAVVVRCLRLPLLKLMVPVSDGLCSVCPESPDLSPLFRGSASPIQRATERMSCERSRE